MMNLVVKTEFEEYINLNIEEDSKVKDVKAALLLKLDCNETCSVERQVLLLNGDVLTNEQDISSLGIGGSRFILWISKDYDMNEPLKKKVKTQMPENKPPIIPGAVFQCGSAPEVKDGGGSSLPLPAEQKDTDSGASDMEITNPGVALEIILEGSGPQCVSTPEIEDESENPGPLQPIVDEEANSETEAEIDFDSLPKQRDVALFNELFYQFIHETSGPKAEELTLSQFLKWCHEVNIFDIDVLQSAFIEKSFKIVSGNRISINLEQLNVLIQNLSADCKIRSNLLYIILESATISPETKERMRFNKYTEYAE